MSDQTAPGPAPRPGNGEQERAKSAKIAPLRGLVPFLVPYRWTIVGVAIALIAASALTLSLPQALRRVIDAFGTSNYELVDLYFKAFVGVAAALAAATALRFYLVSRLGERVIADIRSAVFAHVAGMSPAFYEKVMTAEVMTRLTTDTAVVQGVVGSTASIALRNILLFVGGIVLLLITSPKLTAMTLLIVPLVVVPILVLGRKVRRLSRLSQDLIADSATLAGEVLQAAPTVQAMTHVDRSRDQFSGRVEAAYDAALARIVARSWLTAIIIFLVFTGIIGIVWMGARDVIAGTMSPGTMAQFVFYAIFTAGAVAALSEVWGELQRAAGATERLAELLAMENPVAEPTDPVPAAIPALGAVEFDRVSFAYDSRPDVAALDTVSLSVAPGETVALVGPSGAGKTSVLQMLLRFYDPQAGEIRVDGVPIHRLTFDDLRSRISLVPQEPVIFADTVRANILFGRPDASEAEVQAAAEAAAAHQFISDLPDGYDTWLGERGVLLSGGQKQRIAIARAILRDAPVLLLDEATSALDAESERAVQLAVERLSADRTTLVIAHRLATVKMANRIVVMDQGRVVATGTHDQLVAEGGLYARLARLQFTDGSVAA
ncbi:MAG: ABC transporter transmembrane domain-containing protein [Pseudomonadota bacterium]